MGDEIGLLNDHGYEADPDLRDDGRWMHRPVMDWTLAHDAEAQPEAPAGRILHGLRHILATRKATPALAAHVPTRLLPAPSALLAWTRDDGHAPVTCVLNFTERPQHLAAGSLGLQGPLRDLLTGTTHEGDLSLPPYAALWLRRA
jgi:amylosucrase